MAASNNGDKSGRPAVFKTAFAEYSFCFSILLSQVMSEYFISGFFISIPTVIKSLDIPQAAGTWPASSFTLTTGASLLIFGQLTDIYGPRPVYLCGLAWYVIWSLVCGFAVNQIMLDVGRAFQGFAPAAFLTSGIGLLGILYEPGRRKNIIFAFYSGTAAAGYFFGILIGGVCSQALTWRWYFWIGAIISALGLVAGFLSIPKNTNGPSEVQTDSGPRDATKGTRKPQMDVLGASMFFVSLFLITFSLTDSAYAPRGWLTPYVPALFILGWLLLIACVVYEAYYAKDPVLPLRIFKIPQISMFMFVQFLLFAAFGVWLLYIMYYLQNILQIKPLLVVAWFVPFCLGGLILSVLGGMVLHIVPGFLLLLLSATAWVVACILIAVAPEDASYWPWIFPTMICGTMGIDISYLVASVFLSSSLTEQEQGLAGAVFNSLQFLAISIFLGFADLTALQYADRGLKGSYATALYLGAGCAGLATILILLFLRVGRAQKLTETGEVEKTGSSDPESSSEHLQQHALVDK